jgi:hypothetical protein
VAVRCRPGPRGLRPRFGSVRANRVEGGFRPNAKIRKPRRENVNDAKQLRLSGGSTDAQWTATSSDALHHTSQLAASSKSLRRFRDVFTRPSGLRSTSALGW